MDLAESSRQDRFLREYAEATVSIPLSLPLPQTFCSMAISPSCATTTAGDGNISLRNLCDVLPSPYRNNVSIATRARSRPYRFVLSTDTL